MDTAMKALYIARRRTSQKLLRVNSNLHLTEEPYGKWYENLKKWILNTTEANRILGFKSKYV